MNKYSFSLLAAILVFIPTGLMACGCDDEPPSRYFHYKDGTPPGSPIGLDAGSGDNEGYSTDFKFHDYGPAHVPPPPLDLTPPKRPSS